MTEEVKTEKKRRQPKVIVGDQHEVVAALEAHHAEKRVEEVAAVEVKAAVSVPTVHDVDADLPVHIRLEREAGRRALAKTKS